MAGMGSRIKQFFNNNSNSNSNDNTNATAGSNDNDAKEQPYLMPGTETYEEYESDLRAHNPFRPDDDMHEELESRNEDHADDLRHKAVMNKTDSTKTSTRKYKNYMDKIDYIDDIKENTKDRIEDIGSKDSLSDILSKRMLDDYARNDDIVADEYVSEVMDDVEFD